MIERNTDSSEEFESEGDSIEVAYKYHCPNGHGVRRGAKFCSNCGSKVDKAIFAAADAIEKRKRAEREAAAASMAATEVGPQTSKNASTGKPRSNSLLKRMFSKESAEGGGGVYQYTVELPQGSFANLVA